MKHAREDYNRIQDPANLIPENEPVFLFRAQDKFAVIALEAYVEALGKEITKIMVTTREDYEGQVQQLSDLAFQTSKQIEEFQKWPHKKSPNGPPLPERIAYQQSLENIGFTQE